MPAKHFHLMAKPQGPICNLDCKYCFYLEKENLYPDGERFQMSEPVLAEYIRQYIASQPGPEVQFTWQGGEPTLRGLPFFERAVALQKEFADGRSVTNALQTNATLLDDDWCRFLKASNFLVGVSIDGPRHLHDAYRVDKRQQPTFDKVMRGIEMLQRHQVDFNTLTVVSRKNEDHGLRVYRFLKSIGSQFHQYIPLVERAPNAAARMLNLSLAAPPEPNDDASPVTEWSVTAPGFGSFLTTIFDAWVREDVGTVFVQHFDVALARWFGQESPLCVFRETCGGAMVIEHDGRVYSCDHYVYPKHELGSIMTQSLEAMTASEKQVAFGQAKKDSLPAYCRRCEVRFACNGECPKHRFIATPDGDGGLNYLCAGYKHFFTHIAPYMEQMAELLRRQQPPARVMESFKTARRPIR